MPDRYGANPDFSSMYSQMEAHRQATAASVAPPAGGLAFGDVMSGIGSGASNLFYGAQVGASKLFSDISAIGGAIAPIDTPDRPAPPAEYQYHGMHQFTMSTPQALGAVFGSEVPRDTTAYEYRSAAAQHLGETAARTSVYGAAYTGMALGSLALWGLVPFGKLGKAGFRVGAAASHLTGVTALGRSIAGAGGARVARGIMGLGAGAGGMLLGAAPLLAAEMYGSAIMDVAQERDEITDYISRSSFRYYQGPSKGTRAEAGFGRGDAGNIADSILRQADMDPFYSLGELKGILQQGTQIGMFGGVRDAEDFKERFHNVAETLKTVTKVLHTSLTEGLNVLKSLRDVGITDPRLQAQAVSRADVLGLASGRTASEMLSIGLQGAQVFQGTGVDMSAGMMANQRVYTQLAGLRGLGALTGEQATQEGGMEQFAQRLTAQTLAFARSPFARGLGFAMAPGGQFDPAKFQDFVSGRMPMLQVATDAGAMAANDPMAFIKYQNAQEKVVGEMVKEGGGIGGMANIMGSAIGLADLHLKAIGVEPTEDAREQMTRYLLRTQFGMTAPQVDASVKMFKEGDALRDRELEAVRKEAVKMGQEQLRNQYTIDSMTGGVVASTRHALITRPGMALGRAVDAVSQNVQEIVDRDILGIRPGGDLTSTSTQTRRGIQSRTPVPQEDRIVPESLVGDITKQGNIEFTRLEVEKARYKPIQTAYDALPWMRDAGGWLADVTGTELASDVLNYIGTELFVNTGAVQTADASITKMLRAGEWFREWGEREPLYGTSLGARVLKGIERGGAPLLGAEDVTNHEAMVSQNPAAWVKAGEDTWIRRDKLEKQAQRSTQRIRLSSADLSANVSETIKKQVTENADTRDAILSRLNMQSRYKASPEERQRLSSPESLMQDILLRGEFNPEYLSGETRAQYEKIRKIPETGPDVVRQKQDFIRGITFEDLSRQGQEAVAYVARLTGDTSGVQARIGLAETFSEMRGMTLGQVQENRAKLEEDLKDTSKEMVDTAFSMLPSQSLDVMKTAMSKDEELQDAMAAYARNPTEEGRRGLQFQLATKAADIYQSKEFQKTMEYKTPAEKMEKLRYMQQFGTNVLLNQLDKKTGKDFAATRGEVQRLRGQEERLSVQIVDAQAKASIFKAVDLAQAGEVRGDDADEFRQAFNRVNTIGALASGEAWGDDFETITNVAAKDRQLQTATYGLRRALTVGKEITRLRGDKKSPEQISKEIETQFGTDVVTQLKAGRSEDQFREILMDKNKFAEAFQVFLKDQTAIPSRAEAEVSTKVAGSGIQEALPEVMRVVQNQTTEIMKTLSMIEAIRNRMVAKEGFTQ